MKRYSSIITLAIALDHDEQDGSDITVEQVRTGFKKRLPDLMQLELLEQISLEDTIDRQEDASSMAICKDDLKKPKVYKILPRSKVEKLVLKFIEANNIYAEYGKDAEGLFVVNFPVEEEAGI